MELGNQLGLGVVIAYLLEWLKHQSWFPVLSPESTKRIKVIVGGVAAFLATVGIHFAFDYSAASGGAVHITLPSAHAVFDFAKQWAFQQLAYDAAVGKRS